MTLGRRLHYGWIIAGCGTLCLLAGLGMGRFAIGMLLPAMGRDLGLGYAGMGYISTGNFIGYLVAVLLCGPLSARFGGRRTITFALLLVGGTMLAIGHATGFYSLLALYTLTGMGSAAANVPMMGLLAQWFSRRLRGRAAGFVVIGSGFSILLSGWLVPRLNALGGVSGWRLSWQVLGGIVLLVAVCCALLLRNRPAELGLTPVGSVAGEAGGLPALDRNCPPRTIWHLGAVYFLFGATYVVYATFIVTALVQERGLSEVAAGRFWSVVGAFSLLSGPVFGSLSDRFGRRETLALVFSIQALAYLLAGLPLPLPLLWCSIACYGMVVWSIPSIMAALSADYAGAQRAGHVFGFITFIFAWGQIGGPALAGWMAERLGSFSGSFFLASALAVVGALLALRLPRPERC
ncbi:MAG: MFS transporter [Desulfobulbaceae bacterium A2]|nr:MAG: MFS transporter [Desulfobulbaceae bacterium A2]